MTRREASEELDAAYREARDEETTGISFSRVYAECELAEIYAMKARAYRQFAKSMRRVKQQIELTGTPRSSIMEVS